MCWLSMCCLYLVSSTAPFTPLPACSRHALDSATHVPQPCLSPTSADLATELKLWQLLTFWWRCCLPNRLRCCHMNDRCWLTLVLVQILRRSQLGVTPENEVR